VGFDMAWKPPRRRSARPVAGLPCPERSGGRPADNVAVEATALPPITIQPGSERTAPAQQAAQRVAQPASPPEPLPGVGPPQGAVTGVFLRGDRSPPLRKRKRPDVRWSCVRTMPADDLAWVVFQQHLQRCWREAPEVAGVVVDVEIEGAGQEQGST